MYVPEEILVEILSWLTVKYLLRCICVCKQWQAMILEPKFVELHMRRNKGISHHTSLHKETLRINGVKDTYLHRHSLDGLLLQKSASEHKYIVRNPCMRQFMVVPSPHLSTVWTMIYFHSSSRTYRILSIHNSAVSNIGGAQILELGSTHLSWRPLNISQTHDINLSTYKIRFQYHLDVLYIFRSLLDMSGASPRNPVIFSVDLQTEEVCASVVNVPLRFFSSWKDVKFIVWDGKLALVCVEGREVVVWVLEDYEKQKWCDTKIVIPFPKVEIRCVSFPWKSREGMVWMYVNQERPYCYFIKNKSLCTSSMMIHDVPNTSTLVTIHGMRPEIEEITH